MSDVFFSIRLYLYAIDDDYYQTYKNEWLFNYFLLLFILSLPFILLPLAINIVQLHNELNVWLLWLQNESCCYCCGI